MWRAARRYLAYRQAGRTTSPSEVRMHILVFIDVDIIHSFLCTHSSVDPPYPLQSTPNRWCFEPFSGCRLGHAAAIKRCLTATRPLGRTGGWKGCSKNRHHPHSREKGGVLCTLISKTNYISAMQSTALPPQPFPCTHCPGLLRT